MRRPDYISTEQTRYQPTTIEKIESRVGYAVRKKMGNENVFLDRAQQIEKIEQTFSEIKKIDENFSELEHHSKKGVKAVDIFPILPDDELWKFPCAQVIFDSDPAPHGITNATQNEMMSQAMIRYDFQFKLQFLVTYKFGKDGLTRSPDLKLRPKNRIFDLDRH